MTTTMEPGVTEGQGVAVQLVMHVVVPALDVVQAAVLNKLNVAAFAREGVTIVMPDGDRVDLDLVAVQEVHP